MPGMQGGAPPIKHDLLASLSGDCILALSAISGVVFVIVRWIPIPSDKWRMWIPGQGQFDPKSSWISNTTLLGAVLASLLTDFELKLPDVSGLNIFFAMVAVVAVVLQVGSNRVRSKGGYEFNAVLYSLSAVLAIGAVVGQVLTISRLTWRLPASALTVPVTIACTVVLCFALIGVAMYAWHTMYEHLVPPQKIETTEAGGVVKTADEAATRREWSVL